VVRGWALAITLCLAVAPIGMSCCSSFSCSASASPTSNDLPCHKGPESQRHPAPSVAADYSACHAGEFALDALLQESSRGKVHEGRGYSAGVDALCDSYTPLLDSSDFLPLQAQAISPHLDQQSSPYLPLRI